MNHFRISAVPVVFLVCIHGVTSGVVCPRNTYYDSVTRNCDPCSEICDDKQILGTVELCTEKCPDYVETSTSTISPITTPVSCSKCNVTDRRKRSSDECKRLCSVTFKDSEVKSVSGTSGHEQVTITVSVALIGIAVVTLGLAWICLKNRNRGNRAANENIILDTHQWGQVPDPPQKPQPINSPHVADRFQDPQPSDPLIEPRPPNTIQNQQPHDHLLEPRLEPIQEAPPSNTPQEQKPHDPLPERHNQSQEPQRTDPLQQPPERSLGPPQRVPSHETPIFLESLPQDPTLYSSFIGVDGQTGVNDLQSIHRQEKNDSRSPRQEKGFAEIPSIYKQCFRDELPSLHET